MDPGSSRILLGAAGAGGEEYWITTLNSSSSFLQGAKADSDGNVYVAGRVFDAIENRNEAFLAKLSKSGIVLWQRRINVVSGFENLALDASGNVYAVGFVTISGFTQQAIFKYNPLGVLQWQRQLTGGSFEFFNNVVIAPSGNIYAVGDTRSSTFVPYQLLLYKLDSSGTFQWQTAYGPTSGSNASVARGVCLDPDENIYVSGQALIGADPRVGVVFKFNSSGTLQWQRTMPGNSGSNDWGHKIAYSPEGSVVSLSQALIGSEYNLVVNKKNLSGTEIWKKNTSIPGGGTGGNNGTQHGVAIDGDNNIYVTTTRRLGGSATEDFLIFKLDSSGNFIWGNTLGTSVRDNQYDISLDELGNIYVCGFGNSNALGIVAKLPPDGSLTGTYGAYTYASYDPGIVNYTNAAGFASLSAFAFTRNASVSTYTDEADTGTSSTITL